MNVKKLIEILSSLPPETEIVMKETYGNTCFELGSATFIEDAEAIVLKSGRATETPVVWTDISDYSDLMTIQEFRKDVFRGCLTDDDGYGYYSQINRASNIGVHFDENFIDNVIEEGVFTHVVWFNR